VIACLAGSSVWYTKAQREALAELAQADDPRGIVRLIKAWRFPLKLTVLKIKEALIRLLLKIENSPRDWMNSSDLESLDDLIEVPHTAKHPDLVVAILRVLENVDSEREYRPLLQLAAGKGELGKCGTVREAAERCVAARELRRSKRTQRDQLLRGATPPASESLLHTIENRALEDPNVLLRPGSIVD
jgi:hypothetical protein